MAKINLFILITVIAVLTFCSVIYLTSKNFGLDSDEYLHAAPALDLYQFYNRSDWASWRDRASKEVFYPPLHALILSKIFIIFGPSIDAARLLSLSFFIISLFLSAITVRALSEKSDKFTPNTNTAICTCLIFAFFCPAVFLNSLLNMLEPLGLLLVSALCCILETVNKRSRLSNITLLTTIFAAILLSKHTFSLLVIPGVALAAIMGFDRGLVKWRSTLLTIGATLIIASIFWIIWFNLVDSRAVSRFMFGHHARGYVLGFWANTYYFRSLIYDLHLLPIQAIFGILLATIGTYFYWDRLVVRIGFFSLLLSFIGFGLIAERDPRHIIAIAPYWWILVGAGAAALSGLLTKGLKIGFELIVFAFIGILSFAIISDLETTKNYMSSILEERIDDDFFIDAIIPLIPPTKKYAPIGIDHIAYPYTITFRIAARDGLTIAEARSMENRNVRLPADFDNADSLEVKTILNDKCADLTCIFVSPYLSKGTIETIDRTFCSDLPCQKAQTTKEKILAIDFSGTG